MTVLILGEAAPAVAPARSGWSWEGHARGVFETALIAAGFLVLFSLLPHGLIFDDQTRFTDIETLLRHGRLTDSRFSLVMPLISAPVLLLGQVVKSPIWWAAHFNVIVVAAGSLIAYRLLRGRVDPRLVRLTILVLLFASYGTDALRNYDAETLTATLVTLGIICLATGRHVIAGWAAIVLGVVNTPATIVALGLMALVWTVRKRQLRHLIPAAAAYALIMGEAWLRRGGPFVSGYEGQPGFNGSAIIGVVSILFSYGRGLMFYMPGLLLWLDRRRRQLASASGGAALALAFIVGLAIAYAKWWAWYGGIAWGPRFFLFAIIPASVLVAAGIWQAGQSPAADAITLGVLIVSAWVSIASVVTNITQAMAFCKADGFKREFYCWYVPQRSTLYLPMQHFPTLSLSVAVVTLFCYGVLAYLAVPLAMSAARLVLPRRGWAVSWRI
jgi:hypothetical protein